jgi:hypothetical protein
LDVRIYLQSYLAIIAISDILLKNRMGSGAGRYTGQELNATSPLQRDTVLIPAYSWVVLRFVSDNRERPSLTWNYGDVDRPTHS